MKKQFISLRTKSHKMILGATLLLLSPLYTHAASSDIQNLLKNISFFIKEVLVPVLFGIAFLFFLVNMLKYFVIGGASEEARAKGKKNILYSVIAFVFLISIWSIVTLLIGGLGVARTGSLCPDYLPSCNDIINEQGSSGSFGNVTFPGNGGGVTNTGGNTGGGTTGGSNNGTGSTGGVGGSTGTGGNDSNFAGLAELVFGTGKDSALFTRYTGGPRAIYQTPSIGTTASCESGLNTLLLANTVETTQAAYALYKDNTGATRWKNLTDLHTLNHITYDKDTLDALMDTNISKLHVIHTHQNNRTENLALIMEGHGPSAADMKAMCNNDDTSITYAVVDWNGIWTMQQQADTCPYSISAKNVLPIIETYDAVASTEASTRQSELFKYINAAVTPTQYKEYFSGIDTQEFPSLTPEEVLDLGTFFQTYASTTITYQSAVDAFCNTF